MKLFLLVLLILACGGSIYAQADSIRVWNKYCAKTDTPLLFLSSYNTIEIYSPLIKPAELKIKCLDNTLKTGTAEIKGDTLSMMAMPYATGTKKMRLAILNKKSGKTIRIINFYGDTVPAPVAQFGKINKPDAARKDLVEQTEMKVVFPSSLYSYPYKVKQYVFKLKYSHVDLNRPVLGNYVPVDVLTEIKNAPEGTVIEFTDIKATCPECTMHTLDNLKIRIR